MLKLIVISDGLSINEGEHILSVWRAIGNDDTVSVFDAFGKLIVKSDVPIETQEGIRTETKDVISDIGAYMGSGNYVLGYDDNNIIDYQDNKIKV